jgi:HEAT repeat protein
MNRNVRIFLNVLALPFSLAWAFLLLLVVLARLFVRELLRSLFRASPEALARDLRKGATAVDRERAGRALGRSRKQRATEVLVEALTDPDADVVSYAVQALKERRDRAAIPALVSLLANDDVHRRAWAASALQELPDASAVPPLLATLESGDWRVVQEAVPALGACRDARAVDALARIALDENAGHLRALAIDALGEIGAEAAIEPLTKLLNDPELGEAAGASLSRIPHASHAAIQDLTGGDPRRQGKALRALAYTADEDALEPLLTAARDTNAGTRKRAARALGQISHADARRALVDLLADRSSHVRAAAVLALGESDDDPSVERVIGALEDRDAVVRRSTVEALQKVRSKARLRGLAAALQDKDAAVRRAAVRALASYGVLVAWRNEGAIEALAPALKDPDPEVRAELASYLDRFPKTKAACDLLRELMRDDAAEVRAKAAYAWGVAASGQGDELHPLLHDPDPHVRCSAAASAGALRIENALDLLDELLDDPEPYVRENAAIAIKEIWISETSTFPCSRKAVPRLLKMLDDGDWNGRFAAAKALLQAKDKSLLPRFRDLASPDEKDGRVRALADAAIRILERR